MRGVLTPVHHTTAMQDNESTLTRCPYTFPIHHDCNAWQNESTRTLLPLHVFSCRHTLSMKLAAAPVRTPSATGAAIGGDSTAVSPSHSSVRRRRRHRPASIGECGGGSAAEGGVLSVGGTNIRIGIGTGSSESSPTTVSWTGGGGGMESLEQKITGSSVNGIGGGVIFPESAWVGRGRPGAVGAPGLGGISGGSASSGGGFASGGRGGGHVRGVGVVTGGWHPAAEPTEDENDSSHHDNWRKMRVEELIKDPFLTPGR